MKTETKPEVNSKTGIVFAVVFIIIIGLTALTGWMFDIHALKGILPIWPSIKANAALGLVLAGISLLLINTRNRSQISLSIARIFASLVFLIGLFTVIEYIFNADLGIDHLLFAEVPGTAKTVIPGRMALNMAMALLFTGLALLFVHTQKQYLWNLGMISALIVFILGTLAILGYAFHLTVFLQLGGANTIAMNAAIGLILLSYGIYFSYLKGKQSQSKIEILSVTLFACVAAVLLISNINAIKAHNEMEKTNRAVEHIVDVINEMNRTFSLAQDLETGTRGYVITGDTAFLNPYLNARLQIDKNIYNLKFQISDTNAQKYLDTFAISIDKVMANDSLIISIRSGMGHIKVMEPQKILAGKMQMDSIREIRKKLLTVEQGVLNKKNQHEKQITERSNLLLIISVFIQLILLLVVYLLLSHDISRRKKSADILKKSNEQLSSRNEMILNSIDEGIYGLDKNGQITFVNPAAARYFGDIVENMTGKQGHAHHHHTRSDGSPFPKEECRINAVLRDGQACRVDTEVFWRSDGTSFPVEYTSTPIRNEHGELEGAVVIFEDISERTLHLQQLKASEERWRSLIENASDTIVMVDASGTVLYNSPSLKTTLGYGETEIIGQNGFELFHPEDIESVRKAFMQAIATPEYKAEFELRLRHKNGTYRWISAKAQNFINFPSVGAVVINYEDITEKKRLELVQKERSQILESIIKESSLTGILEDIVATVKRYDPSSVCSILLSDKERKHLHTGAASGLPDFYTQAVDGLEIGEGKISSGHAAYINQRVIVEDINTYPYWTSFRELAKKAKLRSCWSEPILSSSGELLGIFAIYHYEPNVPDEDFIQFIEDTVGFASLAIERSQSEEELKAIRQRYEYAIKATSEAIWEVDLLKNNIIYNENYTKLFGWKLGELRKSGISWSKHLYFEDRSEAEGSFDKAIEEKKEYWQSEYRFLKKDGSYADVYDRAYILYDEDGNATRAIGAMLDITDRKKAEQELIKHKEHLEELVTQRTKQLTESEQHLRRTMEEAQSANRAKSTFLSNMSHEIRTPMNAILGFAEILSRMNLKEIQKEYVSSIQSSGKVLLSLINDILDLSKIDAGKMDLNPGPVNLQLFSKEIKTIFQFKTEQKGLVLKSEVAPELPETVLMDELKLKQIFINLINNAIKFTESGFVKYSIYAEQVTSESLNLFFEVEDTGIGMDKETREKVFQSFVQAEGQDKRRFGGTGLGLAITKQLVEMINGEITVNSKPGKGSIFIVRLKEVKIVFDKPEIKVRPALPAIDLVHFEKATILIVDDVPSNIRVLEGLLESFNFDILTADSGKKALQILKDHKPDIIFMDIRMPGMNGYEALTKIRENTEWESIPVIAATASAFHNQKEEMLEHGFDGYIRKPIDTYFLLECLLSYIKHSVVENGQEQKQKQQLEMDKITIVPALLQEINEQISPLLFELKTILPRKKVEKLAAVLDEMGKKYSISKFTKTGADLKMALVSFNIEKQKKMIRDLFELVDRLSKH